MGPTSANPPLLRDLIDIKPTISTSDYVLKLAEAVTEEGAAKALGDYVVTDRLLDNFDEALGLIKAALDGRTSKAAYLHGSFGSGKSHFMAVLHALLKGLPVARARQEFDPVLSKHEWLQTDHKRFLLVSYHMLGAKSLEQRVLGGYVNHIKTLHPDAPTPQVYRTDSLFEDIRSHRQRMGDEAFIRGLGGSDDDDDEWGDSFSWTPELLNTALDAEELDGSEHELNLVNPSTPSELRAKLVHDASLTWFPGFAKNAAEDEQGFISLDAGLAVIAEHASSLGYDGLILFLDELILWLANRIHDQRFVSREADKITNFVEGSDSRRTIPIVSFIARQRDLRDLVGEETSGAAETAIQDSLNLASGRFDKITLEDRNLPQVAHSRLLRPKDGEAAAHLDAAFAKVKRVGPQIWDVLLGTEEGTTGADEESFRLTYPFSPAFTDTLVHISSALQRSRTGLKLMGQLLANRRDDLKLGELIPLGDLYPVIADGGDKPFVDKLKAEFQGAEKLYRTKLRPFLLSHYRVTEEDIERYQQRPDSITDIDLAARCKGFVGDNRLMHTLLLSALAPGVPALRELTARRLGALNHGSVVSPIPGAEVGLIAGRAREWATQFTEISVSGSDSNPGIRLELIGVDVDSVIANANVHNNRSNRRTLAKRLLAEELRIDLQNRLGADELKFIWKGTHRSVEVLFGDIASPEDVKDQELSPEGENQWRLLIGLPFHDNEYGPADDANRIETLRNQPGERSRTVAWIPAQLSANRYRDFQRLVVIDYALADPQRFDTQYANHLNADNRARAKALLEGQRDALLSTMKDVFRQAYGCAVQKPGDVVTGFDEHIQPVPDVAGLRTSIGQTLAAAARHVAAMLLEHQYPAHPDLDPEGTGFAFRPSDVRTVFGHIRAAAEASERQVEIPARDRAAMRRIAVPLLLGEQKEVFFRLSPRWPEHFALQARSSRDLSVVELTEWLDRPRPMGLEPLLAHLIIASYAEMDDRVWLRSGGLLDPSPAPSEVKPQDSLRSQPLPEEADWDEAGRRFWEIFGERPPALRRGRLVNQFGRRIVEQVRTYLPHAVDLVEQLEQNAALLGLDGSEEPDRLTVARRSREMLEELRRLDAGVAGGTAGARRIIAAFAGFDLGRHSASRYGASIKQAAPVASALESTDWDVLGLAPNYGPRGEAVLEELRGAARADQRTADLKEALARGRTAIVGLLKASRSASAAPQPTGPPRTEHQPTAPLPVVPRPPESAEVALPTGTRAVIAEPPTGTGSGTGTPSATGGTVRRSGGGRTTARGVVAELSAEIEPLAAAEPDAVIEISWRVVE